MLLVVILLAAAAVELVVSPWVMTLGRWQVRFPRTALTLWFMAFFAGCALAAGSVVAAVHAGVNASHMPTAAEAIAVTVASWMSLGAMGAVLAFVAASAEPLVASQRETVGRLAPVAISRQERPGFTLVWFESADPVAYAVPGRAPEILVSTGLRALLSPAQVQAVVAHEYAHLRHRHGWAVRIAEINALCLPRVLRAGRGLRRATLLLIELMADDAAARQAGAVNVANALARMASDTNDPALALRAERLTMRRWPTATRRRVPEAIRL